MLTKITPSTTLAVPLSDVKQFMRVEYDIDDLMIESIIKGVTLQAESMANISLQKQGYEYLSKPYMRIPLPVNPLISVDKIEYIDSSDTWIELTDYRVVSGFVSYIQLLNAPSYNTTYDYPFKITFTAGYDSVPENIQTWVKIMTNTIYENRETVMSGSNIKEIPNLKYINHLLDMEARY